MTPPECTSRLAAASTPCAPCRLLRSGWLRHRQPILLGRHQDSVAYHTTFELRSCSVDSSRKKILINLWLFFLSIDSLATGFGLHRSVLALPFFPACSVRANRAPMLGCNKLQPQTMGKLKSRSALCAASSTARFAALAERFARYSRSHPYLHCDYTFRCRLAPSSPAGVR